MSNFPHLETARLRLREIVEADVGSLFEIHGDHRHMQWFGSDPLPDIQAAKALIEMFASWRRLPNPGTRWALELKSMPGLIGSCGLFSWNRNWRKCAIGYEIAPSSVGNGLMFEALSAVIDWGLAEMHLNRIEAQVHPKNKASVKLLERLGFVQEGLLRQVAFWSGEHHDMLQYSLLRADWQDQASAA